MSFATTITNDYNDVKSFFAKLAGEAKKARQAWTIISSPQVRSTLITLGADAVKLVRDAKDAGAEAGLSVALDAAVVADIKQLIADAKAGDGVLMTDLKALGILL